LESTFSPDYHLIINHVSEQVKCYTVLSTIRLRIAHRAFGQPLHGLLSKWAFLLSPGSANVGVAPPLERGIASSSHHVLVVAQADGEGHELLASPEQASYSERTHVCCRHHEVLLVGAPPLRDASWSKQLPDSNEVKKKQLGCVPMGKDKNSGITSPITSNVKRVIKEKENNVQTRARIYMYKRIPEWCLLN
jgi:hypothetical protein